MLTNVLGRVNVYSNQFACLEHFLACFSAARIARFIYLGVFLSLFHSFCFIF